MPAPPGDGERPRRSALDQLPNRQRALLEQRSDVVRDRPAQGQGRRSGLGSRSVPIVGAVVLLIVAIWLLIGVIGIATPIH